MGLEKKGFVKIIPKIKDVLNVNDIKILYENLSYKCNVPEPVFFVYESQINSYLGLFVSDEFEIDEPFGIIFIANSDYGILREVAVHEFMHFISYVFGYNHDEEIIDDLTNKYLDLECENYF